MRSATPHAELPGTLAPARIASLPVATSEGVEGAGGGVTPGQVLHALRRRWLVAIPLAAAMAAVVYAGADSRTVPSYTARTLVHVRARSPVILYDNLGGGGGDTANHQRTQIATVKSRLVRQAAVRELEPLGLESIRAKADPVAWMEKELVADFTVAPEILRITMKGSNPDELVLILNAVRDSYLREVINKDRVDRVSQIKNLKDLAAQHTAAVKTHRQQISTRAESLAARDLPDLRIRYENLNKRTQTIQSDLLLARLELKQLEQPPEVVPGAKGEPSKGEPAIDPGALDAAVRAAITADPVVDKLQKEIESLVKKVADFERRVINYEDDPEYKQATKQLATSRELLAKRCEELRAATATALRNAPPQPQQPASPERTAFAVKQQIALLETELKKCDREGRELTQAIADLEPIQRALSEEEEKLRLVNARAQAIEVELQAPPRAGVIEDAVIVETPRWTQSLKVTALPAGVAFLAVLALFVWLDLRRGRVNGSADLEAARVRVLGAVPTVRPTVLPAFAPPAQEDARREYLELTDALDVARAVIAPVLSAVPGYTLMVTSAGAGEGKTVVAVHLAARFARSGLRTLLIDTDVRRPRVDRVCGLNPGPGFGELVSGDADLLDVAVPGPVARLDVITAGGCDPRNVAEGLDRRLPQLLRAAKLDYDVVVIDTAPLSTPETIAIGRLADGVVLSVMRDVSRIPDVRAGAERLASVGANVLGAVVTGIPALRYGPY